MPRADGATRGKAPMDRGKADMEERDERRGGESLDPGTVRVTEIDPLGGTLRESVRDMTLRLDIGDPSEDEDGEDVEEGGLLLLLDASVLPWGCCSMRCWWGCADP